MDKFYALLGMLGNTGNDLIFKVTAKQQEGQSIASFYLLALLSGMAITFALFFTFTAFQIGDVALVTPINQLAFVFSTVSAVLILKEQISKEKIFAIVLAVASVITIA